MSKPTTAWTSNPTKNLDAVAYSSAAVTYSSATVDYSSSTVAQDEYNKPTTAWTPILKTASAWFSNAAYATNAYAYDTTSPYDSTLTYDGVNGAQQVGNVKQPTVWSQV